MNLVGLFFFIWGPVLFLFLIRFAKKQFVKGYQPLHVLGMYAKGLDRKYRRVFWRDASIALVRWVFSGFLLLVVLPGFFWFFVLGKQVWVPFSGFAPAWLWFLLFLVSYFGLRFVLWLVRNGW